MDELLEQDHSMTNDDFKGSSTRSSKPSSNASRSRQDKRRRRRTNSEHSSSSSRSSSSSSTHSTQSSNVEQQDSTTSTTKKCRSALAQEHLQTVIEKTKTGHYDVIDNFAFLTFETDDEWRRAFEHVQQHDRYQKNFSTKKSSSTSTKKLEHSDGLNSTLHRSISAPCKSEDGQRNHSTPNSAPVDETMTDNHRSSIWQKNSHDSSSIKTIKTEPMDKSTRSSRNPSEHDDTQTNHHHDHPSPPSSAQKSNEDNKNETQEKKHHHHHHHHHHHKSHKKHKSKHDITVNGDSSTKHPTITSMSDLAKQHIKSESMPMGPPFPFPSHFDPKLFPLPPYSQFPSPSTSHSNPYDHSLMLAGRFYGGQYPRDLPMPPPPPPPPVGATNAGQPSRSLPNVDSTPSMEKLFEKFYPGVLPSYLASSPVPSLNMKMPGTSTNGSEHSLWPHRDAYQRQFLSNSTTKSNSTKIPPHHHPSPSPTDRPHHSSNSNPPTQTPLYIAPVIVTEFHQHQHNHNHTHEHKLNITTKDDRSQSNSSASPRSKSPLSNESKKTKSSFSVNDMFIEKSPMKHSPSPHQQGFLSVMNKKDTHNNNNNNNNNNNTNSSSNPHVPLKKSFNGKWSTAHIHIARMISQLERNQREKSHLNNKLRSTPAPPPLLPPPLPLLENHNDMNLLRPPVPSPFGLPLDMNLPPYPLFRPPPTPSSSSSSSAMKIARPATATSSAMKPPTIKRELKTPFGDDRLRRPSPPPQLPSPALSRSSSSSNFPPSSPSQRLRMDFPSSLLLPPHQHQLANFSFPDDRKRFIPTNVDLLHPSAFPNPSSSSPFFFPMGAGSLPGLPPSPSSRRNVHLGNSDPSKTSLFPSSSPSSNTSSLNPFDFTRNPFLHGGIPIGNPSFESDRYRFIFEQQTRERELQFALMAASANNGNGPGAPGLPPPPHPSLFPDPNGSALFKHY